MIDDIIPELNDLQTLTAVALVDDNLNTSQAVLRVIAPKTTAGHRNVSGVG